jgi:hypothetical protein
MKVWLNEFHRRVNLTAFIVIWGPEAKLHTQIFEHLKDLPYKSQILKVPPSLQFEKSIHATSAPDFFLYECKTLLLLFQAPTAQTRKQPQQPNNVPVRKETFQNDDRVCNSRIIVFQVLYNQHFRIFFTVYIYTND